ncbi:hypothetical protein GCM10022397_25780 [Flavivirga jejuensis]
MKLLKQILFIIIDYFLWIIIGFTLLNYEDFYDGSKGEYFSLESMNTVEKIAYFSYYLWIILNITLILYIAYRVTKKHILKL